MSVLDRSELEQSHLADLHAIASELGIEGYRRLSRDALIEAILAGGGDDAGGDDDAGGEGDDDKPAKKPRGRGRRLRLRRGHDDDEKKEEPASDEKDEPLAESDGDDGAEVVIDEGDDSESTADEPKPEREEKEPEDVRTGVLDILPGGSGFMREDAFVHARDDVYVSPAQIRRCELRAGDELSGPVRPPRRSERYPSLVRVETVNGKQADAIAERANFDDLTPTFAAVALETVHGLPFGKGSRLAIGGPPGAGATRLLREVTDALEGDLDVLVVLAGVRPEEVTEWKRVEKLTVAGGGFDRPPDELGQIAEMAIERAKRIAERGGDAVVIIDGLDALAPATARRVFGAARNTEEAGSLTIVASTGSAGELQRLATTRVVLTSEGTLDPASSGTLRGDLLGG
jgi:transcription termination factor Rho